MGNKVVKANRRLKSEELTRHSAKSSASVFTKIKNGEVDIPENVLNDDTMLSEYLENLILQQMIGGKPFKSKSKQSMVKKKPKKYEPKTPIQTEIESTTAVESESESESESETECEEPVPQPKKSKYAKRRK